jgi:hypothetical protein
MHEVLARRREQSAHIRGREVEGDIPEDAVSVDENADTDIHDESAEEEADEAPKKRGARFSEPAQAETFEVTKTEAEWRSLLSEQQFAVLRQEGALRELKDLRFGNRRNHGKVKILQPLRVGKLGLAQIALQLVLLALGHLVGKKALQIAQVARSLLLRLPSERYAVSGHRRQAQLLEITLHQGDLRV